MKYSPYVYPFVCLSIRLKFLHEVEVSFHLKSNRAWFFEKNLFWDFAAKKPEMGPK